MALGAHARAREARVEVGGREEARARRGGERGGAALEQRGDEEDAERGGPVEQRALVLHHLDAPREVRARARRGRGGEARAARERRGEHGVERRRHEHVAPLLHARRGEVGARGRRPCHGGVQRLGGDGALAELPHRQPPPGLVLHPLRRRPERLAVLEPESHAGTLSEPSATAARGGVPSSQINPKPNALPGERVRTPPPRR